MDDQFYGQPETWVERDPDYLLEVVQQPQHGRVATQDQGDRKPIDPPPILQLHVSRREDPMQHFLQNQHLEQPPPPPPLAGSTASSLHRLKDADGLDGGFFVFGDLRCKAEGRFRLVFALYERCRHHAEEAAAYTFRAAALSEVFTVHPPRAYPGLAASTRLTRAFSEQGVRLRVRRGGEGASAGPVRRRRRKLFSPEEEEDDDDEDIHPETIPHPADKRRRVLDDDVDGRRTMPRAYATTTTAAYAAYDYGGQDPGAYTIPSYPPPFVPSQAYALGYDYAAYSHYPVEAPPPPPLTLPPGPAPPPPPPGYAHAPVLDEVGLLGIMPGMPVSMAFEWA